MRVINLIVAAVCAMAALSGQAVAKVPKFAPLYQFPGGGDAAFPLNAGVVNFNGIFYGVTQFGGAYGRGAVFTVNPATESETIVYSFQGVADGAYPEASLALSGSVLYGTTSGGGGNGFGTVFMINPATNTLTTLASVTSASGYATTGPFFPVGTTLYGTANLGGSLGFGTVFSFNTQTNAVTTIYNFTGGQDGSSPGSALIEIKGLLYGTASFGGTSHAGTVFSINPSTGAEDTLYSFSGGADGSDLYSPLTTDGKLLYSVASFGGTDGAGTIFSIDPTGGAETTLYSFTGQTDGDSPEAGLTALNGVLYGTTVRGGAGTYGTIFSFNPKTAKEETLYAFTGSSDGGVPIAQMIAIGKTLYGTAVGPEARGTDNGAVFALDLTTHAETTLHEFVGNNPLFPATSALTPVGRRLYGTTAEGGSADVGTLYSIDPKSGAETMLYSFAGGADGGYPNGALLSLDGLLYGAAQTGGPANSGTLFQFDPASGKTTTLYSFTGGSDGAAPNGGLLQLGGLLYGTTSSGGGYGGGTIFSFDPSTSTLTTLYTFTFGNDGGEPQSGLIASGKLLYGTTLVGGASFAGNVYSFNPSSLAETALYSFTGGADGLYPYASLVSAGGNLYGTTNYGGTQLTVCFGLGCGVVFEVNPSTGAETVVHAFSGSDGLFPHQALTLDGKTLYGGTGSGGAAGYGTIFSINTASNALTTRYSFAGGSGAAGLGSSMLASGKTLFGVSGGGTANLGEVFSFLP